MTLTLRPFSKSNIVLIDTHLVVLITLIILKVTLEYLLSLIQDSTSVEVNSVRYEEWGDTFGDHINNNENKE